MATDDLGPAFRPAQRLGQYQPLRRIAVGGMAELHLACAVGPGDFRKVVALKRLLPQHALDPQLLHMFLDEARLMARMAHPNIPQVYDVDDGASTADKIPYFAMEYVHGTDLRAVLNESPQPIPIPQLLAVGAAVASGLHYAHEMRTENGEPLEIVHRDVSPSNVLISFGGTVKITDFGVAKWVQQRSLTYSGQLKGKFAHMSPEQCQGLPLDRRSDVFALGTLLYEMATGRPAFAADSDYEIMSRIVNIDVRPPRREGEPLPPDLTAIILRTLRRSREQRHESAQAVQLELEQFARDHRLVISPLAVAQYLETVFSARVSEWREAMQSGWTLAEHLEQSAAGGARASARPASPPRSGSRRLAGANHRTATDGYLDSRLPAMRTVGVLPGGGADAPGGAGLRPPPPSSRPRARRLWKAAAIVIAGVVASISAVIAGRQATHNQRAATTPSELFASQNRGVPQDPMAIGLRASPGGGAAAAPGRVVPSSELAADRPAISRSPDRRRAVARPRESRVVSRPHAPENLSSLSNAPSRRGEPPGPEASPEPASASATSPPLPATSEPTSGRAMMMRVWDPDSPVPP